MTPWMSGAEIPECQVFSLSCPNVPDGSASARRTPAG